MTHRASKGEPATLSSADFARREAWFAAGMCRYLGYLEKLPHDENVNKPGSPYWLHLRAIAGISKAGHVSKDGALERIRWATRHMRVPAKEMLYQWERAYKSAYAWRGPD